MKGGLIKMNYSQYKQEKLKNPQFRAEYEKLLPEIEIIRQLIKARTELNLSQKELADKIGINQSHISRLENGRHNPSIQFLQKVATGLDKTLYVEFR